MHPESTQGEGEAIRVEEHAPAGPPVPNAGLVCAATRRPHPGWTTDQRGPQYERTVSRCSGVAASFVRTRTRNSWGPSIPLCIVKESLNVVERPGRMVV